MREVVAVVGGAAAGTLVAAALVARSPSVRVVIVEPSERLGRGTAYATDCPTHLLNVQAGKISAFPDDPNHFVRWLATNVVETFGPAAFVPRSLYGTYLGSIADAARAAAPRRFRHVRALAIDATIDASDGRVRVACSTGETIDADALVIASGNASPPAWPNLSTAVDRSQRFFGSAWDDRALVPDDPNETVVLIGTGLTAIDAALGLRHNGHRGPIRMISRRGMFPHEHRDYEPATARFADTQTSAAILRGLRRAAREAAADGGNWRGVFDGLRDETNGRWETLPLAEQRRFLRHAYVQWNVHRHRIPPVSAKAIAELIASDVLRIFAGRIGPIDLDERGLRIPVRMRSGETTILEAARIINCSGPQSDVRRLANPLLRKLIERGAIVAHPLGVGVRVASNGAFVDANGVASERLFGIGQLRFGTLIETTAMPEIRTQARDLALTLLRDQTGDSLVAATVGSASGRANHVPDATDQRTMPP